MLETRLGHIYTGITNHFCRRMRQHKGELVGGAKSLRGKAPLKVLAIFSVHDKSEALRLEYQIKQCSKQQKLALIV